MFVALKLKRASGTVHLTPRQRIAPAIIVAAVASLAIGCSPATDGDAIEFSNNCGQEDRVVIFARHAESWTNLFGKTPLPVINPTDPLGPMGDLPLTEEGGRQAENLAHDLSAEVTDVHASAQIRTFQTARAVANAAGLAVDADWTLREVATPDGDRAAINEYFKAALSGERRDEQVTSHGLPAESYNEAHLRIQEFWDRHLAEYQGKPGKSLIVTHGGVIMLHLSQLCNNSEKLTPEFLVDDHPPYTGQVKAILSADGSLQCVDWNGTSLE